MTESEGPELPKTGLHRAEGLREDAAGAVGGREGRLSRLRSGQAVPCREQRHSGDVPCHTCDAHAGLVVLSENRNHVGLD